jgi:ribosome maturation factor RimP
MEKNGSGGKVTAASVPDHWKCGVDRYLCAVRRRKRKRGPPLFFVLHPCGSLVYMVTEQQVRHSLERHLEGTTHFLVDVAVRPGPKVVVEVDNDKAITLEELARLNKAVREDLGEAADDCELQFSSPGMGRPFKVARQYHKHVGRVVELLFTDGRVLEGMLVSYNENEMGIRIQHPSKVKGRLPKLDEEVTTFPLAEIKATKATFKFN